MLVSKHKWHPEHIKSLFQNINGIRNPMILEHCTKNMIVKKQIYSFVIIIQFEGEYAVFRTDGKIVWAISRKLKSHV